MQLDHLSSSSFGTFAMCPRKWKFRYVDRVKTPSSPAQVFGSAVHECVEARVVAGGGKSLSERWPAVWATQLAERHDIDWGRVTPEAMLQMGLRLLKSKSVIQVVDSVVPYVDKKGCAYVEHFFKFEVPGVDVPFVGYADVVEDDLTVADFKTSSRRWSAEDAKTEFQPIFYVAGLRQSGLPVRDVFKHYVLVKKRPEAQVIETRITQDRIDWLFEQVRQMWKAVQAEAFPVCSPMAWWCSEKWCEHWNRCERV